jgi:GntR family transcriptional regulator of gluconate operon
MVEKDIYINKKRVTNVEKIADLIRFKIIWNEYKKNEELIEESVARDCNTSRSTVRSALKDIENEGLIKSKTNGRKIVIGFSEKYIKDLFEIRRILEIKAMKNILEDKDTRIRFLGSGYNLINKIKTSSIDDHPYNDLMFHKNIIVESNNRLLIQCWMLLVPVLITLFKVNSNYSDKKKYSNEYFEVHDKIMTKVSLIDKSVYKDLIEHFEFSENLSINILKSLKKI